MTPDEIRQIFREEIESAFKEVRNARMVSRALTRPDLIGETNICIFRICKGSTHSKQRKIWDSVDGMSTDPLCAILDAYEQMLPKAESAGKELIQGN